MKVCKIFTFDAAHKLPHYEGKCKYLHGHTYKLEVTVDGDVDEETGMVIDFGDLSHIVKTKIIDKFDHTYLNDFIENPTAENIVLYIYDILVEYWTEYFSEMHSITIKLWETPTSWVEYSG